MKIFWLKMLWRFVGFMKGRIVFKGGGGGGGVPSELSLRDNF